jgi:signal transduction histidine kinase
MFPVDAPMGDKHDFEVSLDMQEGVELAEPSRRLLLFQCVRELLFNAVKHSEAKRARVLLWRESDAEVVAEVSDGGNGFDLATLSAQRENSHGLVSIQHRVEFLGGKMELVTRPGQGTRVILHVPEKVQRKPGPTSPTSGIPPWRRVGGACAGGG